MGKLKSVLIYLIILTFSIMSMVTFFGRFKFNAALSDVLAALLVVIWLFDYKNMDFKKQFRYWWYFAVLVLVTVLSNVSARLMPGIAVGEITEYVSDIVKFLIVAVYFFAGLNSFKDKRQFRNILIFWIAGLWVNIVLGIYTQVNFLLGNKISWNNTQIVTSRFLGGFTDPNLAGTYLTLSFFIVIVFIKYTQSKKLKLFGLSTLGFTALCIVLTQSRGTVAGFLVAAGLYVLWNIKKLYKMLLLFVPLFFILYFGFIDVDFTLFDSRLSEDIANRIESGIDEEGPLLIRKNLGLVSLRMGLDYPVLGVGRGNFMLNSKPYVERIYDKRDYIYNMSISSIPHNTFAGIFAEMGIVGLIAFGSIFIILFLKMRKKRNGINSIFFFAFLAFFIQSLALNLENFRGLWLVMGILFALQESDVTAVDREDPVLVKKDMTMLVYFVFSLWLCAMLFIDVASRVPKEIDLSRDKYTAYINNIEPGEEYTLHYRLRGKEAKSISRAAVYELQPGSELLVDEYWHKYPDGFGRISLKPDDDTKGYRIELSSQDKTGVALKQLYYTLKGNEFPLLEYKYLPDRLAGFFAGKKLLWFRKPEDYSIVKSSFPVDIEDNFQILGTSREWKSRTEYIKVRFKALKEMDKDYIMRLRVYSDNINNVPFPFRGKNQYEDRYAIYPKTSTWEEGKEYEYVIAFKGESETYQVSAYIEGHEEKEFFIGWLNPSSFSLDDYLDSIGPNRLVIISLYNEGTRAIDPAVLKAMERLGLYGDLMGKHAWSYIGIGGTAKGLKAYEMLKEEKIGIEFNKGDKLGELVLPFSLSVESAGAAGGNESRIIIDGEEHSKRKRGLNIVVYDLDRMEVADSTWFDTYRSVYK